MDLSGIPAEDIHVFRGKQKKKDNSHMSFVKVLNTGTHRQTVWSKKNIIVYQISHKIFASYYFYLTSCNQSSR